MTAAALMACREGGTIVAEARISPRQGCTKVQEPPRAAQAARAAATSGVAVDG
jgi:hypothetical protein